MMKLVPAVAALMLASAGTANATSEIVCANGADTVNVILSVSTSEAITVLRAAVVIDDDTWSSDPAVRPGRPISVGQAYEDRNTLLVDFTSGPAEPVIARLKMVKASEGDVTVTGGVFAFQDRGAWAMDCSDPE